MDSAWFPQVGASSSSASSAGFNLRILLGGSEGSKRGEGSGNLGLRFVESVPCSGWLKRTPKGRSSFFWVPRSYLVWGCPLFYSLHPKKMEATSSIPGSVMRRSLPKKTWRQRYDFSKAEQCGGAYCLCLLLSCYAFIWVSSRGDQSRNPSPFQSFHETNIFKLYSQLVPGTLGPPVVPFLPFFFGPY